MKNDFPFLPWRRHIRENRICIFLLWYLYNFYGNSVDSEQYREYTCKFLLACIDELSTETSAEDYRRTGYENIYSLFHDCLRQQRKIRPSLTTWFLSPIKTMKAGAANAPAFIVIKTFWAVWCFLPQYRRASASGQSRSRPRRYTYARRVSPWLRPSCCRQSSSPQYGTGFYR